MKPRMSYRHWRAIVDNHIYAPDMPLICGTGVDPEKLLGECHRLGFAPQRVAEMFNRRFVVASRDNSDVIAEEREFAAWVESEANCESDPHD